MNTPSTHHEPWPEPSAAGGGGSAHGDAHDQVIQVIVVGRSLASLEAELRRDARFELVRARTPLAAVGEAATLPEDAAPPMVVVSPDELVAASEADAFMSALRLLCPRARVLRVPPTHGAAAGVAGLPALDALLPAEPTAGALLDALGRRSPRAVAPASAPEAARADIEPVLEPIETDTAIVAALLAGQPVLPAAIDVLRARTGRAEVDAAALTEGDEAMPEAAVPVVHRGSTLAWITGLATSDPEAPLHAAWLAHWLALELQLAELRRAALTDDLTGAHNRRYFDRFLPAALDRARLDRRTVALLALDVDDFKRFNDRFGHAAGDSILIELVRLLRAVVRTGDRVCRLGGDELVIILADPSPPREPGSRPPSSVAMLIDRIRAAVAAHRFPKLGTEAPGSLTISGGLALYPWDAHTATDLLAAADARLLESKRAGKNRFTLGPGA